MANLITQYNDGTFEVPAVSDELVIDATIARTGVQSGKFTLNNGLGNDDHIANLSFPAEVGKIYKYDLWLQTDPADGSSDGVSFILIPNFWQDDLLDFQITNFRLSDGNWRKISVTYRCQVVLGGLSYVTLNVVNGITYTFFKDKAGIVELKNKAIIISSLSMNGSEVFSNGSTVNVDDLFSDISTLPVDPQFGGKKLYYTKSVFMLSIDGVLYNIQEPIGWDKIQLALSYDKTIKGFKFEFTDKDVELQFDDVCGRVKLNEQYDKKASEAVAGFKYGQIDTITNELEILFEAKINFDLFQKKQFVSVASCQRESMAIKFANLYASQFTLEKNKTLTDGIAIADLTKYLCFLHSTPLQATVTGVYNTNIIGGQVNGGNITNVGSGYVDGVYSNIPASGGFGTGFRFQTIKVLGGSIVNAIIGSTTRGASYKVGDHLLVDNSLLGGGVNFMWTVSDITAIDLTPDTGSLSTVPPFLFSQNDIDGFQEPTVPDGQLFYSGLQLPSGYINRNFSIDLTLSCTFSKNNTPQRVYAGVLVYKKSNISGGGDASLPIAGILVNPGGNFQDFGINAGDFSYTHRLVTGITLDADEALFVKFVFFCSVTGMVITNFNWANYNVWKFKVNDVSAIEPSTFQGYKLYDVVSRMFTMMTDKVGSFRSDLLQDGCASGHITGSGKMLRAFPNAQMQVNMKDVLSSLDMLYNVGMSFEWDNDGNETGRLEEMAYFFQDIEMLRLNTIVGSTYVKTLASDVVFNELEFGFNKSPQQGETGSVNEFLTKINILTPIRNVAQKLSKLCAFILSPTYIEQARRQSYQFNSTDQQQNDNDNFLIAIKDDTIDHVTSNATFSSTNNNLVFPSSFVPVIPNDIIVVSGTTNNDGEYLIASVSQNSSGTTIRFKNFPSIVTETTMVTITFSPRLEPKRDEEFDDVEGIPNAYAVYNLQHQLKRVVYRWAKFFVSGFSWVLTGNLILSTVKLSFSTMIANKELRTKMKDSIDCSNFEKENLVFDIGDKDDDRIADMDRPIFTFNKITCQAPMTWTTWNVLRKGLEGRHPEDKNYGYITILNPDGIYESGYLFNGTFDPTKQIANLELREKYNA